MAGKLRADVEVALTVSLRVEADGTVSLRNICAHSAPVIMARPYSKAELAGDKSLQGDRWHGGGIYVHGGRWGTPSSRALEARADGLAGELRRLLDRFVKTWCYGLEVKTEVQVPASVRYVARRYVQNALHARDATKRELVGTWYGSQPGDGTWFTPDSGEPVHTGYVFLGEHGSSRLYLVTEVMRVG